MVKPDEPRGGMNWWIVEDALKNRTGHWIEYLSAFQRDLLSCGDRVQFFCDREAEPFVVENFSASAILPPSIWHKMSEPASRWKRLLRIFRHGLGTWKTIRRTLRTEKAPDLIFVPTVLVHHLLGWVFLINSLPKRTRLLLFFPNTPISLDPTAKSARLAADPTARLFGWLIRRLKPSVLSGKVILGVETHSMRDALTELLNVPFTYFPHPVSEHETVNEEPIDPLTFGCYGAARFEKGNDILQLAIAKHLERSNASSRFVIQWISDFHDADGNKISKHPDLLADDRVEFITDYFADGGYAAQLAKTDVMMLPYRDPYRFRVSRVVIEAMVHGMPVIASRGTTLHEQASRYGTVETCAIGDINSIATAIEKVERDHQKLSAEARDKSSVARAHFSIDEFRARILESDN